MSKKFTVNVGDRVAYSVQFLKSIGESHGEMARARGVVKDTKTFGGGSITLAYIEWDEGFDMPEKVAVHNLAKVGPNPRFAEC